MKRHAPATIRNSGPIADILEHELPDKGLVFELASGTGEHVIFFAKRFPGLDWQPSDMQADALGSIAEYAKEAGLQNIHSPIKIDATSQAWPIEHADALLCTNMVHISPWLATIGLFQGAAQLLDAGAPLVLYGPYLEAGVATAQSNIAFNQSLRSRDPNWGLRNLAELDDLAEMHGFIRTMRYAMPANNLMLIYRRTS